MKRLLLLLLLCVITFNSVAQIQMNTTGNFNDPSYLIDNVLIGNGVITSNHSYIGNSSQIGYFTDSLGLIGMSEGFVLSTGSVDSIGKVGVDTLPWWNYIYDSAWNIIDSTPVVEGHFLSSSFSGNSDPDLLTIANSVPGLIGQTFTVSSTGDAAILEFDFVPSADTVKFNYVFASEEYLAFVNSSFNDVFAILISGPGITGSYASPVSFPGGSKNISVVPGSANWPVTVSTVNNTLNSQYYNHDTMNTVSAFNGYTDVFTAKSAVIPGLIYHVKIAIADGTDQYYDSGIFVEAGSFMSFVYGCTDPTATNYDPTANIDDGSCSNNVSFCESFDFYQVGAPIAQTSPSWNTWDELMNGATAPFIDDALVDVSRYYSPPNSLYIPSTAAAGPEDIVLMFDPTLNITQGTLPSLSTPYVVGDFIFSQMMYISSGGGAYMNFQAENTPGVSWALEVNFDATGDILMSNTSGTSFTSSFPFDTWFEIKFEIDLSNNDWEVIIDGVSQGSFANTINQIASLDIYPRANDEFWLDDVCYSYTPETLYTNNGQVSNINTLYGLTGQTRYPSVEIRNFGTDPIYSFDVTFDYNGTQITENVTNINSGSGLLSLTSIQVDFSNSITLISGTNTGHATVSNVNGLPYDDNPSDDILTTQVVAITPAAGKLVIGERATGTWNGWCPRGIVNENWMTNDYPSYYQAIAVHNGDPMTDTDYNAGISPYIGGYPSGLIDRGSEVDPADFEQHFLQRIVIPPSSLITNIAQLNANNLQVDISLDFQTYISGNWKLACALVEDSVTGTGGTWYQSNSYGANSITLIDVDGTDWGTLPSWVPDVDMIYRHVAREIQPSFSGGSLPLSSYSSGSSETITFNFTLDPSWDTSQISIVAMLINPSGEIDNASSTLVSEAINSGNSCPPSLSYTTIDATDAFTNDGAITVTVDPSSVGPFDYYLINNIGNILQGPFMSQNSNVFTFLNLSTGFYQVAVNNQNCTTSGFNTLDSVYVPYYVPYTGTCLDSTALSNLNNTYSYYPDTIQNLPNGFPSVPYNTSISFKTPSTLLEFYNGDSSLVWFDTVLLGMNIHQYMGDWPVDSFQIISVYGLPNGFGGTCFGSSSCVYPGNDYGCVSISGITGLTGTFPLDININIYTHGVLDLGIIQYPISTSIFDIDGFYHHLTGYEINIGSTVYGCTDPIATNYDPAATMDDGSCIYCNISSSFYSINPTGSTSCDGFAMVNASSTYPIVSYNWTNSLGVVVSANNAVMNLCNDIYIVTITDSAGCTFVDTLILGTVYGCTSSLALNYNPLANTDDGSCIYPIYGCTDLTMFNYNPLANTDDGSCIPYIYGCMNTLAYNYNPLANTDDGSCQYCDLSISQFIVIQNSSASACDGWAYANAVSSNTPVLYSWSTGSSSNNIVSLCSGTYTLTVTDAVGCVVDTTFIIGSAQVYGCTDPTASNYNPLATIDDGSCTYATCGGITGIYMTDVIHDRARFNWDNMNSQYCQVDQIRFRYREVGTNSWSTKTMGVPVGSGCNTSNTSKLVLGLTPSTTYEYDFKIWYCNASTVNWHANGQFTTAPQCDNVINVIPTPITTTKTQFCWDSVSTYAFVRLQYRENVPGSSFSNIGGMGVFSPILCKDKNGLTPGTDYRVMWRTWCSPNGGPYRSAGWDGPVLWTQPTSIRIENETSINNLEIYPNPSRDVFNVSFTSETKQSIEVRVVNLVGEIIFTENLEDFEGEYTHSFNLSEYSKGIYLLELDTDNGKINKKLILQ